MAYTGKCARIAPRAFDIASDNVITVAGMRGCGKTTFAKHLLRQFSRTCIYDPLGQYTELGSYVPHTGTRAEFEHVARWVWNTGNMMFAIEECEAEIGERMAICPDMWRIINQGRNRGIGLMAITRRIANLSKTVFSLSDHVFLFRFFSPADVNYCKEFLGSALAARLRVLPKYHFIYYGEAGTVLECPPVSV